MKLEDALKMQIESIHRSAEPLERYLLEVEMQLASNRRRLQDGEAYTLIAEHWLVLHPPEPPVEPSVPYPLPIPPPHRLAMPRLHDEPEGHIQGASRRIRRPKKNKGGKICFRCNADDHLSFNCPRRHKFCWHCGSRTHWPNDCLFRKPSDPRWCGKCLQMTNHNEVDCPVYELCHKCGSRGPFKFLRTHRCGPSRSASPTNDADSDVYDLINPEA